MLIPQSNITPVLATRNKKVSRPINISPNDVTEDISQEGDMLTLTATKFHSSINAIFEESQWQISKSYLFSDQDIVYDQTTNQDHTHALSNTVFEGELSGEYYWRVRYKDISGSWSKWSTPTGFNLLVPLELRGMQAATTKSAGYFIDDSRDLWGAGHFGTPWTSWNYLGDTFFPVFNKIIPNKKFKMLACDVWTSGGMALDTDGKIWTWGWGEEGQFGGDKNGEDVWPPKIIFPEDTWKYIFASEYWCSFGIKDDGTLWAWGDSSINYKGTARSGVIATSTNQGQDWSINYTTPDLKGFEFISLAKSTNRYIAALRTYTQDFKTHGLYVAVSDNNGETWQLKNLGYLLPDFSVTDGNSKIQISHITYGNGKWILSTSYGGIIKSEDNGETWTVATILNPTSSIQIYKIIYGNGIYYGHFTSGSNSLRNIRSTDLVNWTVDNTYYFNDVTFDGTNFVAAELFQRTAKSADGITWTLTSTPWTSSNYPRKIFFLNNRYFAPGVGALWTSIDGVNWSNVSSTTFTSSIAYDSSNNKWVALGAASGVNTIGQSTDGITWTNTTIDTTEGYGQIIFAEPGVWKILGAGADYSGPIPLQVGNDNDWVYVEGFFWNGYGWKSNGDLYVWGYNYQFSSSFDPSPEAFAAEANWQTNPNAVFAYTRELPEPFFLGNYPDFDPIKPKRKINWCSDSSLLVKPDGTLWAGGRWHQYTDYDSAQWGTPCLARQLGTDNDWDFVASSAEYYYCAAVKKNGDVYVFGDNGLYRSGSGEPRFWNLVKVETGTNKIRWLDTGFLTSAFQSISTDNNLITFGASYYGEAMDSRSGNESWYAFEYRDGPPLNNPEIVMDNIDWSYTDHWSTIVKTFDNEFYVAGMNNLNAIGTNELAWYELSFPHRIFTSETIQNTDVKSLQDSELVWRRFAFWSGVYDPEGDFYDYDPWNYEPMRDWNWSRGFGWYAGGATYLPFARYPSDVIKRDQTVPYQDWDQEDGLVYVGSGNRLLNADTQTTYCLCYSHLKEISYLYLEADANTNLIDLCDKLFKNLEKLEVLEVYSTANVTIDLSKFPLLDFSSIVEFTRSANVTVINRPPGFTL